MAPQISIDAKRVAEFCRKWRVRELSLFGSVLQTDFSPQSDVDVLVSFEPDAPWSLMDWGPMLEELRAIFGRDVDLVEREGLRNPFRQREILRTQQVLYAA